MPSRSKFDPATNMADMQAGYLAAKRASRLRRTRRGVPAMGAGADFHYASEADYLWMGECARDMDRNDMVIGQLVDRVLTNTIQDGFTPDPNTGDEVADQELRDRFAEESLDAALCDTAGELTFHEQEQLLFRETIVAGDVFALPIDDGTVQIMEFHRCRSPQRTKKNIVHGIEMDEARRRTRFWFTKEPIEPHKQATIRLVDLQSYAAYTPDGEANVWHVFRPKRPTQTRGVTALAPIFDAAGMHDDIQFSVLLKQQLANCFLIMRQRAADFDPQRYGGANALPRVGPDVPDAGSQRTLQGLAPGTELTSLPGEKLDLNSPNIPSQEFFQHAKLVLTFLSINVGLPLCVGLLDASETNFSGYRGAVDQARLGFKANQRSLISRFHIPWWRFKVARWAGGSAVLTKLLESGALYRHTWRKPNWQYIEPVKDATADLLREANMLTSPRRRHAERGTEYSEIVRETVEDRKLAIVTALTAAETINKEFKLEGPDKVIWRDLAPLPVPERLSIAMTAGDAAPEPAAGDGSKPEPPKPSEGRRAA